jgi:glucosamine--fructose-6-phosphate aminotransferase (isomerizing)
MCGIVGYVGKRNALPILLEGLKRLEYRGYDSAGVALLQNGKIQIKKCVGKVSRLEELTKDFQTTATVGIGHTRWATHGIPNDVNAHPHTDCHKHIALIHKKEIRDSWTHFHICNGYRGIGAPY